MILWPDPNARPKPRALSCHKIALSHAMLQSWRLIVSVVVIYLLVLFSHLDSNSEVVYSEFILLQWTVNRELWPPKNEEKQAIDEQIIPFKGKHKLKIFTPRKPRRWGFKLFSRCGISGILYDFAFYELCRPKVEKSV
ncbi:hypothetical protein T11_13745, partial [Trichinella zimbabwensis]